MWTAGRRPCILQQFPVRLRHTKLPSFWDSHVNSLAKVWKMLVILLMLPASRTRRETVTTALKNSRWLLHKPSKTQNLPPNFCQLLCFSILRSTKLLFTPGFRVANHPLSNNQPPIGQRLGTCGGPFVTSKVSNALTEFRTKFHPISMAHVIQYLYFWCEKCDMIWNHVMKSTKLLGLVCSAQNLESNTRGTQ